MGGDTFRYMVLCMCVCTYVHYDVITSDMDMEARQLLIPVSVSC